MSTKQPQYKNKKAVQTQNLKDKGKQGEWGSADVFNNGQKQTDLTQKLKERLNEIYSTSDKQPENFVAQMQFTQLNSFLLTTDGRVFSWGGFTPCLGRQLYKQQSGMNNGKTLLGSLRLAADDDDFQFEEQIIDEVQFSQHDQKVQTDMDEGDDDSIVITQIATGRQHVLALDSKGHVYAWGRNDHGQLGLGEREQVHYEQPLDGSKQGKEKNEWILRLVVEHPTRVIGDKNELLSQQVCQIYAGQYQSFAITKSGYMYAWGDNTHGQLLLDNSNRANTKEIRITKNTNRHVHYLPSKVSPEMFGFTNYDQGS